MDTEGEPKSTERRARHGERSHRSLGLLSLLGLGAAVLAVVVGLETQLSTATDNSALSVARANVHRSHAQLVVARQQLAQARAEAAAAGVTLAAQSSDLAKDQAALARAQTNVVANGVNISALDSCLSGIEQTLNQIAVNDVTGATSTLRSVEGTCQSVHPASS